MNATLSHAPSWQEGWVVYTVTMKGGAGPDPIVVVQKCVQAGQVVYNDFKGVYWSPPGKKLGSTSFPLSGDTVTAYVAKLSDPATPISDTVEFQP